MYYNILMILIILSGNICCKNTSPDVFKSISLSPRGTEIDSPKLLPSDNFNTIQDSKTQFDTIDKDIITGKVNPLSTTLLEVIPDNLRDKTIRYANKEVIKALQKMAEAAEKDGVKIIVISAFRSFEDQKKIWENKWNGRVVLSDGTLATSIKNPVDRAKKILQYSSMPGTSRHHWGTDLDFNNLSNTYFEHGQGKTTYEWLTKNADKYGFCQPYTQKNEERLSGYEEEKWHWTYVPIASKYTEYAKKHLKNEDFKGFDGANTAVDIDVLQKYILGIHPKCNISKYNN